jgi:hypothetical protein
VILRLGVGGATVMPSIFMQALAAANGDDEIANAILDRVWHLNPLLGKTGLELVAQRTYHKDELYKHLASAAYPGIVPSRPALETWLQFAIGTGLLRARHLRHHRPAPSATSPSRPRSRRRVRRGSSRARADHPRRRRRKPRRPSRTRSSIPSRPPPVGFAAGAPSPPLREACRLLRSRSRRARLTVLAGVDLTFDDGSRRDHRAHRVVVGRSQANVGELPAFGLRLDAGAWVENGTGRHRVAVASALAPARRDRAVVTAFAALDKAGVLGDLYQGTVPENLPAQVDARALMLASLAARRCAEVPELASQLEGRASAAEAWASLDTALGRGLFRSELFWIMDMLAELGVIRYDDLGDFTVTPPDRARHVVRRLHAHAVRLDNASLTAAHAPRAGGARRSRRRDPHAVRACRRLCLRLLASQGLRFPLSRAPGVAQLGEFHDGLSSVASDS